MIGVAEVKRPIVAGLITAVLALAVAAVVGASPQDGGGNEVPASSGTRAL
jgi:hypothetical protein